MHGSRQGVRIVLALLAVVLCAWSAAATTIGDIVRVDGQGEDELQGLGLVVGLAGTGDSAKEMVAAEPLAEVLRKNGIPITDLRQLKTGRSAAVVMVRVRIPRSGARPDDLFDCEVSTLYSAPTLRGGMLYLTALTGPYPGSPVYAMASGRIELDGDIPTVGVVRQGAKLIRGTPERALGESILLIAEPHYAGYAAMTEIASSINQEYFLRPDADAGSIATVIDERTIRLDVPEAERTNAAAFLSFVLTRDVTPALLRLPAQVICNARRGAIVITGNVRISPVAIRYKDLTITTVTPPPTPAPNAPVIERSPLARVYTEARPAEMARLEDLNTAFKQLDVPVEDQIAILQMMHKAGQLHARLVIE